MLIMPLVIVCQLKGQGTVYSTIDPRVSLTKKMTEKRIQTYSNNLVYQSLVYPPLLPSKRLVFQIILSLTLPIRTFKQVIQLKCPKLTLSTHTRFNNTINLKLEAEYRTRKTKFRLLQNYLVAEVHLDLPQSRGALMQFLANWALCSL